MYLLDDELLYQRKRIIHIYVHYLNIQFCYKDLLSHVDLKFLPFS